MTERGGVAGNTSAFDADIQGSSPCPAANADLPLVTLGAQLIDRAHAEGRPFDSWTAEWLRYCLERKLSPLDDPHTVLELADCDRYSENRLGEYEKRVEMEAFVKVERLKLREKSE